jgi:NADH:ubiquinone oxidoreductase subunit 5 (subunit L)/multisubunit Na+/H+ antiporter MnhA subunit
VPAFDDPLLGTLPVVLVATGLLIMAVGEMVGRWASALIALAAWLAGGAILGASLLQCLTVGGWDKVAEGGWRGAALYGSGPVALVGDPMTLLLAIAVHVSAGALLLASGRAWGGGHRRENAPTTAPQLGGAILVIGFVETQALAAHWAEAFGLCALAAAGGTLLLLTSRGTLDSLTGAGRLFIVHRLGDVGLLFAAALLLAAFGDLDPSVVLRGALDTPPSWRALGALDGYPATWIYTGVGAGLLLCIGTRVCLFPFLGLMKHTHGAPAALLGTSHGIAFAASGLILALKTAALFPLAPQLAQVGAIVAAGSALLLAASALATDDGVLSGLRLIYGLAAVGFAVVLDGQTPTALLGALVLLLAVPVVVLPMGACVEAMQGQTALSAMGGLFKALRKSDTVLSLSVVALVGVPGFVGFFFFERAVFGALVAARGNPTGALFEVLFVLLFSLGLWRITHLAFSGDAPRAPAPAVLVEASWRRILLPGLITLALAGSGLVVLFPEEIAAQVVPDYFVPFDAFTWPAVRPSFATMTTVAGPRALLLPESIRWVVMGAVAAAALSGYALSFGLFRRGGRPALRAQLASPALEKLGGWLDGGASVQALTDRLFSVPVSQASRVTNDLLLPFFIDGPLSRLPGLAASLLQTLLRLVHSGDVQRAVAFLVLALGVAFTWWSTTP